MADPAILAAVTTAAVPAAAANSAANAVHATGGTTVFDAIFAALMQNSTQLAGHSAGASAAAPMGNILALLQGNAVQSNEPVTPPANDVTAALPIIAVAPAEAGAFVPQADVPANPPAQSTPTDGNAAVPQSAPEITDVAGNLAQVVAQCAQTSKPAEPKTKAEETEAPADADKVSENGDAPQTKPAMPRAAAVSEAIAAFLLAQPANPQSVNPHAAPAADFGQTIASAARSANPPRREAANANAQTPASTQDASASSAAKQTPPPFDAAAALKPDTDKAGEQTDANKKPLADAAQTNAAAAAKPEAAARPRHEAAPAAVNTPHVTPPQDGVAQAGVTQTAPPQQAVLATPAATEGKLGAHIEVSHHESVSTLDKLGLAIATKSVDGVRHFDIRLDPPELGRVQVHLSMDDAGRAQASLVVDKPQTLELLQRDAATLNRALSDAGLDLPNNGLNFSLREQYRQSDSGGMDQGRSRALSATAVVQTDASQILSSLSYAPNSVRVDIRV